MKQCYGSRANSNGPFAYGQDRGDLNLIALTPAELIPIELTSIGKANVSGIETHHSGEPNLRKVAGSSQPEHVYSGWYSRSLYQLPLPLLKYT